MKKTIIVKLLAGVCFLSTLSSCANLNKEQTPPTSLKTYTNVTLDAGFDTIISYSETTTNKETFNKHFKEVEETFTYCNNLFDIYHTYDTLNNIKTINDNAGIQPVKVDPLLIEVLLQAKEFYDLSNGEFDITSGALLETWHTYRTQGIEANEENKLGELPPNELLQDVSSHKGFEHIEIDQQASTVYLKDKDMKLDLGGIAKGFTTEYVANKLLEQGVNIGSNINAGGNIRTLGKKADNSPWRIGIQDPRNDGSLLSVNLQGAISCVTSGDYERYYIAQDNKRYHHIIDPLTNYPADYYLSVTVFTKDASVADCLSTTLFTMSIEDGEALLNTYNQQHKDANAMALWIYEPTKQQNGSYKEKNGYYIHYTTALEDSINWR